MAGRTKGGNEPAWSWEKEFAKPGFKGAPVSAFAHSNMPLANYWHKLAVKDMLVETRLYDHKLPNGTENAHWIAKVLDFAGYMTKIAFEGYDEEVEGEGRNVRWVHFCEDLFRIGYSAENKLPIVPPPEVIEKQKDWRDWIVQRVTGGFTMHPMLTDLLKHDNETQLEKNMQVEVLDKSCISRMRLGYVVSVVGHRVHVKYWDANANIEDKANFFWCHELSDSINVVGWSKTIGHDIHAPSNYNPPEVGNGNVLRKDPGNIKIEVGMKLEAVDPLNLSVISAATVVKVLKHGYFLIRIESAVEQLPTDKKDGFGNSRFCYHITSKLIFPCGFCKQNGIPLMPPYGYNLETFDWEAYFKEQGGQPLPLKNLKEAPFEHEFTVGAKLEAVDVMEPDLICVATVVKVIGRLLRIRFDGWGEDFDQWADAASCDLFPIGWCRMMDYALQEPHVAEKLVSPSVKRSKTGKSGKNKRKSTN